MCVEWKVQGGCVGGRCDVHLNTEFCCYFEVVLKQLAGQSISRLLENLQNGLIVCHLSSTK